MPKRRIFIWIAILLGIDMMTYVVAVPIFVVNSHGGFLRTTENVSSEFNHPVVGIVFGAGVNRDGTPSDMLKDRLGTAAKLYNNSAINTIVVSGDNRVADYDEPTVMFNYLVNTLGIPEAVVVRDYAGLRTYDTCVRAHTLWGIDHAILVTQKYHLPRALMTCRKLGIESVGVSASVQPYYGQANRLVREFFAIHKAIVDLFVWPPSYIGGDKERDLEL